MVKSLRRAAAKARLFRSCRWHRWWAWFPVLTESYELVLWEWVERRRLWREDGIGDPCGGGPVYYRYTEYRMPMDYYRRKPLP